MNSKNIVLLSAIGALLLLIGVGIGYVVFGLAAKTDTNVNATVNAVTANSNANTNVNAANANDNTNAVANTNVEMTLPEIVPSEPPETTGAPKEIASLDLIGKNFQFEKGNAKYYDGGTIKDSKYAGQQLVLLSVYPEGPAFYPSMFRFAKKGTTLTLLTLLSDGWTDMLDTAKFTKDTTTTLAAYNFSKTLTGKTDRQVFTIDDNVNAFFNVTGLKTAFTDATWGKVYLDDGSGKATDIFAKNGFYLRAPDGTARVYTLDIDFQNKSGVLNIIWTDGATNSSAYTVGQVGGCGLTNYATVIADGSYAVGKNLKQAGTSSKGDAIYEISDSNDTLLKKTYDDGLWATYPEGRDKGTYAQFVAKHPFIFWTDPFGRLLRAMSNEFVPQAECAKPAIYLYPQKATDVHVTVDPKGGMLKSIPTYADGWTVRALPNGSLTEVVSGATYPYLFWEGRSATLDRMPARGFVVKKEDVPGFLGTALAQHGLNTTEIKDFQDYWVPNMQSAPYYFITFLTNATIDKFAPLSVTPQPDTVIRVLMDFKPLDKPMAVQGYTIRTPERKGFTVVEWGGVRR